MHGTPFIPCANAFRTSPLSHTIWHVTPPGSVKSRILRGGCARPSPSGALNSKKWPSAKKTSSRSGTISESSSSAAGGLRRTPFCRVISLTACLVSWAKLLHASYLERGYQLRSCEHSGRALLGHPARQRNQISSAAQIGSQSDQIQAGR